MAERAFQTQLIRFGAGGVNVRAKPDVVPPEQLTRGTNHFRLRSGALTARAGETALTDRPGALSTVHSIARMNDVLAGTFQRVWGIDTFLYYGATGALTLAESGFSGDPLTIVVADAPIPGLPWAYIADRTKMRKIRSDGLDMEIGLPAGVLLSAVPSGGLSLVAPIAAFDGATGWVWEPQGLEGATVFANIIGPPPGLAVSMTTDPGTEPAGYNILSDIVVTLDLSTFPGSGGVPITDLDVVHFWIRTTYPDVSVVLIYFVSGTFTPGVRPGFGGPGVNDNYFTCGVVLPSAAWKEFSGTSIPVIERGSFVAHGPAPDWATIKGISIFSSVGSAIPGEIDIGDMFITSSSVPGTVAPPYDYRVTNYDPRTGVEGNPSPIQPASAWVSDPLNVVVLTPGAYGDAAIRQRFYRRGNTLPDNWFFLGQNASDGGVFYDTFSDAAIAAAPTVQIDHDQPVTSTAADGSTILDQPIPVIFGPISEQYFGLGDPHRPSTLYASQPNILDYWPATFAQIVSAPGETLQNGYIWGAEGYVSSNARWYRLIPNLANAANTTAQPTGATKGQIARWAAVVGPDGIHFISDDGWYLHKGGPQVNLTDAEFYPLFNGEAANGYFPVDFSRPALLRMGTRLNEVWFQYADTEGTICHMVRDVLSGEVRIVIFGVPTAVVVGEIEDPLNPPKLLLLGGLATGRAYTHTGTSDDTAPITVTVRTAALDQGFPRNPKQYGDVATKAQLSGVPVTVHTFLDDEAVALAPVLIPGDGVQSVDPFGGVPTEGRNVSLEFTWSTAAAAPVIDFLGPSYLVQPDTTVDRISDWDDGGSQAEKFFRGVILDCDTGGVDKTVVVEGTLYDGSVTTLATLTVNAAGRRKLTFTWDAVYVSFFRIRPTDSVPWTRFSAQFVYDEEPLRFLRWETEPLDHGIVGWKSAVEFPMLTLRSFADVTLVVTAFYDNGGSAVETYTVPSTAGVKTAVRLTLRAGKGVLYSYVFTSATAFLLYREETTLYVKPLAGDLAVKHFIGNDNLELIRGMQSAEGTAAAPGGGEH